MKKILFICATNNSLKGTEKALSVLMSGLEMEYEIHFLAIEREQPVIKNSKVTFHFLSLSKKYTPKFTHKLLHFFCLIKGINNTIKKVQPDIVISSLDEINIATGLLIKSHPTIKFIATVHTNPEICITGIKKFLVS